MGIRTVRTEGDECLRKVCKPVKSVSLRTRILIEDMFDTMYESGGVGSADRCIKAHCCYGYR